MTDQIPSALTAEEWAAKRIVEDSDGKEPYGYGYAELQDGSFVAGEPGGGHSAGVFTSRRRAIAALCLHGQPFGFTQEDVKGLRNIAEAIAEDFEPPDPFLLSIANRIVALLPPREDT